MLVVVKYVKNLGMRAFSGVFILSQWAKGSVTSYGSTRQMESSSLREKTDEHKNSQAHKQVINILETATKDVFLNLNAQSEQNVFQSTAQVFRKRIMWQKITNLLQTLNVLLIFSKHIPQTGTVPYTLKLLPLI